MELEFEWGPEKAANNEHKHRVTFDEASSAFADELSVTIFDPLHSDEEERFVIMGMSNKRRLLAVCFPDQGRADSHHQCTRRQQAGAQRL